MKSVELVNLSNKNAPIKSGDIVSLSGTIYTARDRTHKLICDLIKNKKELPINLNDACIYYCGPTPAQNGAIIGSCGPTTSARMDAYTQAFLENGVKYFIGKGRRSAEISQAIKRSGAMYLLAIGGAGALYSKCVKSAKIAAFEELGCEAIFELLVENMELVAD